MRRAILVALTLAIASVSAPAAASNVKVVRGEFSIGQGVYTAGPGEANRLTADFESDGLSFTVTDPGAVIVAGDDCESIDAHTARCHAPPLTFGPQPAPAWASAFQEIHVALGDMGDTFTSGARESTRVFVDGGPGDDVLVGGVSRDRFDGGGGTDRLLGGESDDELTDGDRSGAADGDYLDGGAGDYDALLYDGRTASVAVDLSRGVGGEPGEDDTVLGFERASGGAGDDQIAGTDALDYLYGNGGDDRISALPGDDFVYGGDGEDRLQAGEGDDIVDGGQGSDAPTCGRDRDTVLHTERGERLGRSCEYVQIADFRTRAHPIRVRRRAVWLDGRCPDGEGYGGFLRCRGTFKLHEAAGGHRRLGRAAFSLKEARPVKLRLTKRGRRLVRRRHGVVVNVSYRAHEASSRYDNFDGKADWAVRIRRGR